MTGYCKVDVEHQGKTCTVEMRSVNHRFLDARVFLPKSLSMFEEPLKKQLKEMINRGKVDVSVTLGADDQGEDRLSVDPAVLENLNKTLKDFQSKFKQPVSVGLGDLMQIKGLIKYDVPEEDDFDYSGLLSQGIAKGAEALCAMRETEGRLLYPVLSGHLAQLADLLSQVPPYAEEIKENSHQRLSQSLTKLGLTLDPEDPRVMQEIGFQLDRADITEEIERFEAHLSHFDEILTSDEPVGRKLDFLCQELNREANTLCSKSGHSKITEIGVNLKTELEKVREQIQNIE